MHAVVQTNRSKLGNKHTHPIRKIFLCKKRYRRVLERSFYDPRKINEDIKKKNPIRAKLVIFMTKKQACRRIKWSQRGKAARLA